MTWPYGLSFRRATRSDLQRIVEMLADDVLGQSRERLATPLPETYYAAFEAISRDPNNELCVAVFEGIVVGVMQVTFIPYLTHQGSWRALIEGVRVAADVRGKGVGRAFVQWAIDRAAERRCRIVQLTTDKSRREAIHFYESIGFRSTHEGMKLHLRSGDDA